MEPDLLFDTWIIVDGDGVEALPSDLFCCFNYDKLLGSTFDSEDNEFYVLLDSVAQYLEQRASRVATITVKEGWGARLSMPGYLDCTEWTVFDTKAEAEEYLEMTYAND